MDINAIRSGIPFLNTCLYFNTGGIAPSLKVVTDSLVKEFTAISQQGPPLIMDPTTNGERFMEARRRIAALLGVDVSDLCLTRGVVDGITTLFNGFDWAEGDELIITDEEHPAVQVPADRIAAAWGVKLKRLVLSSDADEMLRRLKALITPRTRLLTLSHVTTDTGTRLPAKEIVQIAHEHEIPVAFDGAQSLGQFPVDVPELGADFYSILNYKWLFGPYSTGALYIAKPWQGRLTVLATGARSERRIGRQADSSQPPEGARRFEVGALSQPLYYATATGIDYVRAIGIPEIEARTLRLAALLREGLKRIPGLTIESPEPAETSTGIVTFRVDGIEGQEINASLRKRRIFGRPTSLKFKGVRISVAFFTTEEELEAVVKAVAEIVKERKTQ